METAAKPASTEDAIKFLMEQNKIFSVMAWRSRWAGWVCGWGTALCAAFAGVCNLLFPGHPAIPAWVGLIGAALAGFSTTIHPGSIADAYYRGHILIETALGDHLLGRASFEDLSEAWRQAQAGLPGAVQSLVRSPQSTQPLSSALASAASNSNSAKDSA
jgi:hypothetical protein